MYTTGLYHNGVKYEWGKYVPPKPTYPYEVNGNTLIYMPLTAEDTVTNYGNLTRTFTQNGGTFVDNYYQTSSSSDYIASAGQSYSSYSTYTIMAWVNCLQNGDQIIGITNARSGDSGNVQIGYTNTTWYNGITFPNVPWTLGTNKWNLLTIVGTSSYLNGVYVGAVTNNTQVRPYDICINRRTYTETNGIVMKISQFIFEDRNWTAQEVADYYNNSKAFYGL